ncbi:PAS domain S-box protein [Tistrella bauzanensis]
MAMDPSLSPDKALFAEIIDATHDAIVVIDAGGVVQFANRATELMFGYSPAELIGSNISRLMRPEEAASHDRYLLDADPNMQRRIIGRGRQLTARRRDGSIIPIDLVVSPLPRSDPDVYRHHPRPVGPQTGRGKPAVVV